MARLLIATLLVFLAGKMVFSGEIDSAARVVKFSFDVADGGGPLLCNGIKQDLKNPTICQYDNTGHLLISRDQWHGNTARLSESGEKSGACATSVISSPITDNFNLSPVCDAGGGGGGIPQPERKAATGEKLLDEWYSDLPWHQKLSTKDSNIIDIPLVLPFEAIPKHLCQSAETPLQKSRCMLRYGIVNVMAMHRTDTVYTSDEASADGTCQDKTCIEVKLDIQRFHTHTNNSVGLQADEIKNNAWPDKNNRIVPSLGFALTEATIFAPSLPWYTGHFCGVTQDGVSDSVCYEDYFTTQLQAAADTWLTKAPALFDPHGSEPGYTTYCQAGRSACTMYLAKVDWTKGAAEPHITECGNFNGDCKAEVLGKTGNLIKQVNKSLTLYLDDGRYPWHESSLDLSKDLYFNPFIGFYDLIWKGDDRGAALFRASHYVLPKKCTQTNYLNAARWGKAEDIQYLKDCALNFEIHSSGFHELWQELWDGKLTEPAVSEINTALPGSGANQYGRTMFMYAGVPEQQLPVSFKLLDDGVSIHDKLYTSSIYTQFLPMVNPADQSLFSKSYTNAFWHAFFMSNHMNQTPDHFIRGVRGRTLWHNEYRSSVMYESAEHGTYIDDTKFAPILKKQIDFPAGFQEGNAKTPFHGNTCDACHIRNGSGLPLMPNQQLPKIHQDKGMQPTFNVDRDYTYSNKALPSMKLVLFDLKDTSDLLESCDDNNNSGLKPAISDLYKNKIMNFYGNSFHVNQKDNLPSYQMEYKEIAGNDGFEIVDKNSRGSHHPTRVEITDINAGTSCKKLAKMPDGAKDVWPSECSEVSGQEVSQAIYNHQIGFMPLLGHRLGNTPLIEMMPDKAIMAVQQAQSSATGKPHLSGCYSLAPGTRVSSGNMNYRSCLTGKLGATKDDCYLGRFGWIGDRASLEDQIANAASVEMNISSKEGYATIHPNNSRYSQWVRYNEPSCGPADETCQDAESNSDLTEQEIKDMATYQRWIGIPNRSEYQVSSKKVQLGEKVFNELQCNICHVINKIAFDNDDNMLPDEERAHLKRVQTQTDYPFISYLGTDLLMHDMGYLSQIAKAPPDVKIRMDDGTVLAEYKNYVQHIRTPALKGLRFNQFVTDSNHNTKNPIHDQPNTEKQKMEHFISGCDFLLHDGRACDAVDAAFLHDGPLIKKLGVISALNNLTKEQLEQLRAFLYSL